MILLYASMVLLFGIAAIFTAWRARRLEKRYAQAARQADALAKELSYRGGNCVRPDAFATAKRQYELGRMVQIRDRLEEKHDKWDARAGKLRAWRHLLLHCKGRFAPYLLGAIDVVGVFMLLSFYGVIQPDQLRGAIQAARMVVSR